MPKNTILTTVTQGEFAKAVGKTPQTIADAMREGLPHEKEARNRVAIPVIDGVQWWIRNKLNQAVKSKDRQADADADISEMKRDQLAGSLVEVAAVQAEWAAHIGNARARLLQLPSKVAVRMEDSMSIGEREAVVRELVHEALSELAGRQGAA